MTSSHVCLTTFARSTYTRSVAFVCALLLATTADTGQLSPCAEASSPLPGFTLEGLDGQPHKLEDYRGKVVLINFWATWCPPCLAELPGIQRLADELGDEPFQVLLVDVGESPFRVAKFLRLIGIRVTALLDPDGEAFRGWDGRIYPTSFLLDSGGRVRYTARGPIDWDSDEVQAVIRNLLPQPQTTHE